MESTTFYHVHLTWTDSTDTWGTWEAKSPEEAKATALEHHAKLGRAASEVAGIEIEDAFTGLIF